MLEIQGGLVTVLAIFILEPQSVLSTGMTVGLTSEEPTKSSGV